MPIRILSHAADKRGLKRTRRVTIFAALARHHADDHPLAAACANTRKVPPKLVAITLSKAATSPLAIGNY
jgi:hypothetical protein